MLTLTFPPSLTASSPAPIFHKNKAAPGSKAQPPVVYKHKYAQKHCSYTIVALIF